MGYASLFWCTSSLLFVNFFLEEELLAYDLEGAHLLGVLLLSQEYLAITALTNLGENLEITMSEAHSALAERSALSAGVLVPQLVVFFLVGLGRGRNVCFEGIKS